MFELVQVSEQCYFIESPSKVGIYRQNEKDVYLIDSGSDKGSAKRTLRIAKEQDWNIKGIINTHAHADHIGGNAYIQKETGCDIFCSTIDIPFIEHTLINPLHIYGGYFPQDLRHKFFLAESSKAKDISSPDFPNELKTYDISGHSLGMIAIVAPDGTAFVGDIVSSEFILKKYGITYLLDIKKHLMSLDFVEKMNAKHFVMSHVDTVDDIKPLIDLNRKKIFEIADKILELLKEPKSFEALLKELFYHYELSMNFKQHSLVGSTVRSYLSWLKEEGKLQTQIVDNILLWKTTQ
ncbi:MAG: MBL fold metallo-hydrolase [Ruminococcaceae bacterium]|nr:MBL fold metallo-hydrolase [Oscillospiraceae bacterium]